MMINGKTNKGCVLKNCTCNNEVFRHKSKASFRRKLRRNESIIWKRDNNV